MENKAPNTNNQNIEFETPELEVDQKITKKAQSIGVILFVLIALIIASFSFISKQKSQKIPVEEKKDTKVGTQINTDKLSFSEDNEPQPTPKTENTQTSNQEKTNQKTQDPFSTQEEKLKFRPKVYKSSSAFLINSNSNANIQNDKNRTRSWEEQAREEKEYSNGIFNAKNAHKLNFNPSLLLAKGTYIGCSLNTKLVSTIKGGISCTVSEDVYSEDGVTLLIEKGSKISGYFQSGQMSNGVNRIFVLWQEIRTPNHINIPVFSGASDALGGSGIEGYVDHHWLERFGGAVLISMIDDAFNYLANGRRNDGNGNSNYDYTQNTRQNTQQMATEVLKEFIKIQPTLYKNQGDLVGVYVNRDIDFSGVYRLKVRQ